MKFQHYDERKHIKKIINELFMNDLEKDIKFYVIRKLFFFSLF